MNFDNVLSSINQRIKQVYKYFGPVSQEYQNIKAAIFTNDIPRELVKEERNKPIVLSRSKKALEGFYTYETELRNAHEAVKGLGTVLQMARTYEPTVTGKRLKDFNADIRKAAVTEAIKRDMVDERYAEVEEIEDETEKLKIKRRLSGTKGLHGDDYNEVNDKIWEDVAEILARQGKEAYKNLTGYTGR